MDIEHWILLIPLVKCECRTNQKNELNPISAHFGLCSVVCDRRCSGYMDNATREDKQKKIRKTIKINHAVK